MNEKLGEVVCKRAELQNRKNELEAELKTIKSEIEILDEQIITMFTTIGIDRMAVNGITVSLREEHWASALDGDYDRACEALQAAGLGEYVQNRFNTQSLSAFVREMIREERPLPESFENAISVTSKVKVSARRG